MSDMVVKETTCAHASSSSSLTQSNSRGLLMEGICADKYVFGWLEIKATARKCSYAFRLRKRAALWINMRNTIYIVPKWTMISGSMAFPGGGMGGEVLFYCEI